MEVKDVTDLRSAELYSPCNVHLNEVAENVKRGIWEGGGVPKNLPVVRPPGGLERTSGHA
jgi:dihydroxyacid dehydratase/phosphogluconate dehydratase